VKREYGAVERVRAARDKWLRGVRQRLGRWSWREDYKQGLNRGDRNFAEVICVLEAKAKFDYFLKLILASEEGKSDVAVVEARMAFNKTPLAEKRWEKPLEAAEDTLVGVRAWLEWSEVDLRRLGAKVTDKVKAKRELEHAQLLALELVGAKARERPVRELVRDLEQALVGLQRKVELMAPSEKAAFKALEQELEGFRRFG